MRRILFLLLTALFLPVAARGQVAPPSGLRPYVLHFPGNSANVLIAYTKNATSGTFTLTVNGLTTAPIAFNATGAQVQAALAALAGMAGHVTAGGAAMGPWAVVFDATVTVASTAIDMTNLSGPISLVGAFVPYTGAHVDHGHFWGQAANTSLGTAFWWEAWVKPITGGYLVSDGSGGAHALLWGLFPGSSASGTGNVYNGTTSISFQGNYGINSGEWVWAAVGWDGTNIYTYINGICDGQTSGLSARTTSTTSGHLYVGGSDHINAGMDLAYLAGWERTYWTSAGVKSAAIQPSRIPKTYMVAPALWADFAAEYTTPGPIIRDLSANGYEEVAGTYPARRHNGTITTSPESTYDDSGYTAYSALNDNAPLAAVRPRWIVDPTCPYAQPFTSALPREVARTPAAVPGGAVAFDSFERHNQTPAFQLHPTLGSTEGGTAGALPWQVEFPDSWGILGGRAVPTRIASSIAWVNAGITDQDVRVTRAIGTAQTGGVGCCFRVKNAANHWFAYCNPTTNNVTVYSFTAGVLSSAHTFTTGSSTWTILRIVAHGSTITPQVSVDGSSWIVDPSPLTDTVSDGTWTGAGVATGYHWNSSLISSLERCDNFTVLNG